MTKRKAQEGAGGPTVEERVRRGRLKLFLSLLHEEVTVLRALSGGPNSASPARQIYQCLIALVRPPTLWLKWESQGLSGAQFVCIPRLELLREATRRARENEAKFGPGLWMEFGVFRGESLRAISAETESTVYGLDSFEGLPSGWGPGHPRGTFRVRGQIPSLPQNVKLVPGLFAETLPHLLQGLVERRASFVHVDCDLYSGAKTALHGLESYLQEGSVVVFDEFCGLLPDDEARAFREFLRASGCSFRYLDVSSHGAVSVEIGP